MKPFTKFGAIAALAFSAGAASAQVTQQGNAYLFRLKLHKGEKVRFRIPFTVIGLTNQPLKLQFRMNMSVVKVKDGISTVKVGKLDSGSQPLPGLDKSGGQFEVDSRGRVNDNSRSLAGFCVQFPEEPLRIGESFAAPVSAPVGGSLSGGVDTVKGTFTFTGFAGKGARKEALFKFKVAGNRAPGGTIAVRVSDGLIDRYTTKFYVTPPGASPDSNPLTVSATIIRL